MRTGSFRMYFLIIIRNDLAMACHFPTAEMLKTMAITSKLRKGDVNVLLHYLRHTRGQFRYEPGYWPLGTS